MGKVIRIDDDVFKKLQERARPLVDTPNDVLRTALGLEGGADTQDTTVTADTKVEKESGETIGEVRHDAGHQKGTTEHTIDRGKGIGKLTIETSDGSVVVSTDFEDALYERLEKYLEEVFRSKRKGRKEARYKAYSHLVGYIFDTYLKSQNY